MGAGRVPPSAGVLASSPAVRVRSNLTNASKGDKPLMLGARRSALPFHELEQLAERLHDHRDHFAAWEAAEREICLGTAAQRR